MQVHRQKINIRSRVASKGHLNATHDFQVAREREGERVQQTQCTSEKRRTGTGVNTNVSRRTKCIKRSKGVLLHNFKNERKDEEDVLVRRKIEDTKDANNMYGDRREKMWRQAKRDRIGFFVDTEDAFAAHH